MQTKMRQTRIPGISRELLELEKFLAQQEPDAHLEYRDIQRMTGVVMNERGKEFLRRAAKRQKLPYVCVIGHGIILASSDTVMPILNSKVRRVGNAIKTAIRTHKNLAPHVPGLSAPEKTQYDYMGNIAATVKAISDQAKQIYLQRRKNVSAVTTVSVPYPKDVAG